MSYAKNTTISVEDSQADIQNLLRKHGATKFGIDYNHNAVLFELNKRSIRINLPMPVRDDYSITLAGQKRNDAQIDKMYDQAVKQKWRALLLIIRAKLEAIESGITTMEDQFLSYMLLPNGQLLGDYIKPQLENVNIFPQLPEKINK